MAIFSAAQIVERNPGLSPGGLKNWMFDRKANGMESSGAVFKIGRRNYIDEQKFNQWMEDYAKAQAA